MKAADLNIIPLDVCERILNTMMYCPERGRFVNTKGNKPVLMRGFCKANNVWVTCFEGHRLYQHRMAFLFMTGKFPELFVDHIDRDSSNNVWSNLRECSHWQNMQNRAWSHSPPYSGRFTALGIRGVGEWYCDLSGPGEPPNFGIVYHVLDPAENRIDGYSTDFFEACAARKSLENKTFVKLESMEPIPENASRILSGDDFDKLFA